MNLATELIPETASRKERDGNFSRLDYPALPSNPHIEIEDTGRVGQRNHHFALHGHAMPVDFAVEGFAEGDRIRVVAVVISEPNVKLVEEMKASPVDQTTAMGVFVHSEKDRRSEDSLKAFGDAAVISAVFRHSEEVQHLSGALEMYGSALLAEREGRDPDGDEPVLAKRKAEIWMPDDMKEEASVPTFVDELILGNRTERKSAKYKWPSVKRDTLLSLLALFPNKQDGVDLLEPPGGQADARED